jgi:two-component system, LuxR family, response regulator FixJ
MAEQRTTACAVAVIDTDHRRRAALVRSLLDCGFHAEPYEMPRELEPTSPNISFIMLHDDAHTSVSALLDRMEAAGAYLEFVCFAERPTTATVVQAMRRGAIDYFEWPITRSDLEARLPGIVASHEKLKAHRLRRVVAVNKLKTLTRRERDVLAGIVSGATNRKIAEHLRISARTVEIHRLNMIRKLRAQSTVEAARIAFEGGWLE